MACCGTFGESAYTGALKVLKVILNYEYLWVNLRVKGGAYGCMSSFGRNGETMLVSYRDPKLGETNRVYEGIPEYLRTFSIDDRDMTKYVIGAFSELDAPLNPAAKGARNLEMCIRDRYLNWLPMVLDLMPKGAVLISDNVLQDGDIIQSRFAVERRNRTIHSRMREYLYELKHTEELETSVIPIGDGVTVSTKIR